MRKRSSKLLQKLWKLPRALRLFSKFFDDSKILIAPENKGDTRASYAVPQVALNSRGSLDVGWDMTDHRNRGAPSGSVNFVFFPVVQQYTLSAMKRYVTFFVVHVSHFQRNGCQPEKNYLFC